MAQGMGKEDMKALFVSALLFFMLLIGVAYLAPRAYEEITSAGTNETSVSDVPGGAIFTGLVILLGMFAIGFAAVIKILDVL